MDGKRSSYSSSASSARGAAKRASSPNSTPTSCGCIEFDLYPGAIPVLDLTANGSEVAGEDKISLLATYNSVDVCIEPIAGCKGEFYASQPATVNDVYSHSIAPNSMILRSRRSHGCGALRRRRMSTLS
jgi:hypothetical protein